MDLSHADKRKSPRRRTLKRGQISFHNLSFDLTFQRLSFDCLIRDVSEVGSGLPEMGACLQIESPGRIPDAFDLFIRDDASSRKCRVVWRSANRLGVAFE